MTRASLATFLRAAALSTLVATTVVAAAPDAPVADAASRNDAAGVVALLKRGADVNSSQGDGMTALHWAAMNNAPELAEMLGIPFIAYVCRIEEMFAQRARVKRMIDEGYEIIETPLPAVITVTKEINVPRLPSLRGITRARKAVIPVWKAQDLGVDASKVGLSGSFTRVVKIFFPRRAGKAEVFHGDLESQVVKLAAKLKESGF